MADHDKPFPVKPYTLDHTLRETLGHSPALAEDSHALLDAGKRLLPHSVEQARAVGDRFAESAPEVPASMSIEEGRATLARAAERAFNLPPLMFFKKK